MDKAPAFFPKDAYRQFEQFDLRGLFKPSSYDLKAYDASDLSRREELLRQALDLIRKDRYNGDRCVDIVQTALHFGLFDLAKEALNAILLNPLCKCTAIEMFFESRSNWHLIDEAFLVWCIKKLLSYKGQYEPFGFTIGRFESCREKKSEALAKIGVFLFAHGRYREAFGVWNQVPDKLAVDAQIYHICVEIINDAPEQVEVAELLMKFLQDKHRVSALLIKLSKMEPDS